MTLECMYHDDDWALYRGDVGEYHLEVQLSECSRWTWRITNGCCETLVAEGPGLDQAGAAEAATRALRLHLSRLLAELG